MENFEKQLSCDVLIEKANLLKATIVEASIMKSRLLEDIQLKNKNIFVDVSKCTFIDSMFLGALVVPLKRARETGGDIKLVIAPSSATGEMLSISGILRVFESCTSVEDVLKSFRS